MIFSIFPSDEDSEMPAKQLTRQALIQYFQEQASKEKVPRIGLEVEKIGIYSRTGENANYTGSKGYLAILGKLYEELGWEITKQNEKYILQLKRGNSYLNLESDGRIELAGSPHESVHDLAREFRIHQNEIKEVSDIYGIAWLGIGYHPVSLSKDIKNTPDPRKQVLVDYFEEIKNKTGNDLGLAWYKKTAGIHANIDYVSDKDFALKAKVFTKIAPIITAMYANSPFSKREFTGSMCFRYHVTTRGLAPHPVSKELFDSDFGFEAWIDHVLSLPFLFLEKDGKWIRPGISFGEYMENGFEGHHATWDDFDQHTKALWKDVKLKNVIEIRSIDSLPPSLVPSVAALIKGLAYDESSLKALEDLVQPWTYHDYQTLQEDVAKMGTQASVKGEKVLDIAKKLIMLAEEALKRNSIRDASERDESYYLEAIKEYIFVKEKSPAEWLVEQWEGEWRQSFFPVFKWCQY
jgi:glutamate--cysteine ligase